MPTKRIRSLASLHSLFSLLGGAALTVGIVLATQARAMALVLPYTFTGTRFDTSTTTDNELSGDFSLNCDPSQSATSCVTADLDFNLLGSDFDAFGPGTYSVLSINPLQDPVFYKLDNETVAFTTGIYGYNSAVESYFLFFNNNVAGIKKSDERFIQIWLNGTLPTEFGNPIGVTASAGGETSQICTNLLPNTAANPCPGGQIITITNFGGTVNFVPSPFSVVLLIPAAGLMRLRRRYQPED